MNNIRTKYSKCNSFQVISDLLNSDNLKVAITQLSVFPEPRFSGGQLTPAFENQGSMQIFEGQLGLTPSSSTAW